MLELEVIDDRIGVLAAADSTTVLGRIYEFDIGGVLVQDRVLDKAYGQICCGDDGLCKVGHSLSLQCLIHLFHQRSQLLTLVDLPDS